MGQNAYGGRFIPQSVIYYLSGLQLSVWVTTVTKQTNNTQYAWPVSSIGPVTHIIVHTCRLPDHHPTLCSNTCYPPCGLLMSHNICVSTKWLATFSHPTCYTHYDQLRYLQARTFCNPLYGLSTVFYPVRPVSNYEVNFVLYISLLPSLSSTSTPIHSRTTYNIIYIIYCVLPDM